MRSSRAWRSAARRGAEGLRRGPTRAGPLPPWLGPLKSLQSPLDALADAVPGPKEAADALAPADAAPDDGKWASKLPHLDVDLPSLTLDKPAPKWPELPDVELPEFGKEPKFVKGSGGSTVTLNVPGAKPLPNIVIDKPDVPNFTLPPPDKKTFVWNKPALVIEKPEAPNVVIQKVPQERKTIHIEKPAHIAGNVTVIKTVSKEVIPHNITIKKPDVNLNITIVKGEKLRPKPFKQAPGLNLTVLKFDKTYKYKYK